MVICWILCMFKLIFFIDVRVCKILEFCRDEFIFVDEIFELFIFDYLEEESWCSGLMEFFLLLCNVIGWIVYDVWGSKGVWLKRVGKWREKFIYLWVY